MVERLNLTLLGHKDHGKSTLIGRLLLDTRSVKEDRVREVEETCRRLGKPFEHCFLLDSFTEEREGGMTMDVIHAQIKGQRHLYDCIDVPGHKELVKNMLTGASHADAGILIASAAEGLEEQTGHHLRLARWLGLDHLVVAVNKMDRMGYERKVFDRLREELEALFGAGGGSSAGISFVPVSAMSGDNVVTRSSQMPWYGGPTLFEAMEALRPQPAPVDRPFRMPVQSLYPGPDGIPLVVGRIESGRIEVGERIAFVPGDLMAVVRGIHGASAEIGGAGAGENVGLALEPQPAGLARGTVAAPEALRPPIVSEIRTPAIFLEELPAGPMVAECGTATSPCQVELQAPLAIGEVTPVTLRFSTPMVAERSRTAIGRLAIKHQGRIIGVASVV